MTESTLTSTWTPLAALLDSNKKVLDLCIGLDGILYAAWINHSISPKRNGIDQWNGQNWVNIADWDPTQRSLPSRQDTMLVDGSGNLYVSFYTSPVNESTLIIWNGTSWQPTSYTDQNLDGIKINRQGTIYIIGGAYARRVHEQKNGQIYKFSTSTQTSDFFPYPVNDPAKFLYPDQFAIGHDDTLWVTFLQRTSDGRAFTGTANIYNYDAGRAGNKWQLVGTFASDNANGDHLIATDDQGNLYLTGNFESVTPAGAGATAITAYNFAKWDGAAWQPLASNLVDPAAGAYRVDDMVCDDTGRLYVVGTEQRTSPDRIDNYAARWDDQTWQRLGNSFNSTPSSIVTEGTDTVYVGGSFTKVGTDTVNYVASFEPPTIDANLLAHYALDDPIPHKESTGKTGTMIDIFGHNWTPAIPNFDFNNFSISVRFKADSLKRMPLFCGGNAWRWIVIDLKTDGTVNLRYNNSNRVDCPTLIYKPGEWHTALFTYDGMEGKLYLDGTLGCTAAFTIIRGNTNIGFSDPSGSGKFVGEVRDLNIYGSVI